MNLTIFKGAMRRGILTPFSIIINCVVPLGLILFANNASFMGPNDIGRVFYLTAMAIMWGAFTMAKAIQQDRATGVIHRILAGPVSMGNYLVQNFFAALVPMVIISTVIAIVSVLLHDWSITIAFGVAICYIFLAASAIGLSFAWSCIFKDGEASAVGVSMILTVVATIGGFMLPLFILPDVLRYIGALTPAHWASRAIEELLREGFTNMYWLSLLAMAMFAFVFIAYGSKRRMV